VGLFQWESKKEKEAREARALSRMLEAFETEHSEPTAGDGDKTSAASVEHSRVEKVVQPQGAPVTHPLSVEDLAAFLVARGIFPAEEWERYKESRKG